MVKPILDGLHMLRRVVLFHKISEKISDKYVHKNRWEDEEEEEEE